MKTLNRTMIVSFMLVVSMILSVSAVFADEGTIFLDGGSITLVSDAGDVGFAFGVTGFLPGNAVLVATDESGTGFSDAVWSLVDARGTGAGWSITVGVSNLTGLQNSLLEAVTLTQTDTKTPAYNQFGMTVQIIDDAVGADVTVMPLAHGSMPLIGLEYLTDTALVVPTGTALPVLQAPADQGMGGYDIDPLFTLYMPAGTYEGSGILTVTVTQTDAVTG